MATIGTAQQAVADTGRITRPYSPCWVDHLANWIRRLPVPAWVFYLAWFLVAVAIETVVKWRDGAVPVGTIFPFHVVYVGSLVYLIATHQYIFDGARSALHTLRPVMTTDEAQYDEVLYRLTNVPSRGALIASVVGIVVANIQWLLNTDQDLRYSKLATSPLSAVVDYIFYTSFLAALGAIVYGVVHLLVMVNRVYTQHASVSIFKFGPLYALAGVPARVTILVLLAIGAWSLVYPVPGNTDSGGSVWLLSRDIIWAGLSMVAIAAFVLPLWGVHRILEEQKKRLLDENAMQLEATAAEVHRRLDADQLQEMDKLKAALDGLTVELNTLERLSTWPWRPDTLRLVSSAVLLPILVYLSERVLTAITGH